MISRRIDLKSESAYDSKREHDVVRKPRRTFRHHALGNGNTDFGKPAMCGFAVTAI
jgi:hypothetical protein